MPGGVGHGGATLEVVCRWMTDDTGKIALLHFPAFKLWLQYFRIRGGATEYREARGIRIKAMGGAWFLWRVHGAENGLQRIAVEATAGVHRQWCWFIEHDQRGVFVQNFDGDVDLRFNL